MAFVLPCSFSPGWLGENDGHQYFGSISFQFPWEKTLVHVENFFFILTRWVLLKNSDSEVLTAQMSGMASLPSPSSPTWTKKGRTPKPSSVSDVSWGKNSILNCSPNCINGKTSLLFPMMLVTSLVGATPIFQISFGPRSYCT